MTLLLFAHTFYKDSKVNRQLLASLGDKNVKIWNLNEHYLDNKINVDSEIAQLQNASKIIIQFPMFWFSCPSILKEWCDRVLSNILYGNKDLLNNKSVRLIVTIGGKREFYESLDGGIYGILSPLNLSFKHLGARVETPFCIFGDEFEKLPIEKYLLNF